MKRWWLLVFLVGLIGAGIWFFVRKTSVTIEQEVAVRTVDDVISQVLSERQAAIASGETADFASDGEVVVLLLGLDARKGDEHPHCDAIHFFSFDLKNGTIKITTIPRGTYAYIPGKHAPSEYYLSNSCALEGLDYGITQIEKVAGLKHDYLVTVGFSQTLGILRLFDLPTTTTLQWLRHRQSYAIGEPQRSHNQAIYMKDMMVGQLHRFREDITLPMEYIMYKTVDTDLDFATARAILQVYVDSRIDEHPEKITLEMKPFFPVVDYHLDTENPDAQVQALVDYLKPHLSHEDLSLRSMESIQAELIAYLLERTESTEPIADLIDKQLWLQVEDAEAREDLHYRVAEKYVAELAAIDHQAAVDYLSEYVLELEVLDLPDERAKALLADLIGE
jgi:hypothetical protein